MPVRAIASDQVRDILRSLGENLTVWYAPDQRYTEKMSAIVPFFGQPAATNIATSRLARISGARVLPYFPERLADGSGYVMRIGAPLEDFPSDPVADALRFHALIEAHVRRSPEQYLWTYKRLKLPQPAGGRISMSAGSAPSRFSPRYWPTWLALAVLRFFEPLPYGLQAWLGRNLGRLLFLLPTGFKRIARRNIELCYPQMDARERESLLARRRKLRAGPVRDGHYLVESGPSPARDDDGRRTRAPGRSAGVRQGRDPPQRALHDARDRRPRDLCAPAHEHHVPPDEERSARAVPEGQSRPACQARHSPRRHPHADRRAQGQ